MEYCIYIITNSINDKIYIGRTNNLKRRWNEHRFKFESSMPISKAIKKYGAENFVINQLLSFDCEEDSYMYESAAIVMSKYFQIKSYNITNGGDGPKGRIVSDKTKKKISESNKGAKNHNFGKLFYDRSGNSLTNSHKDKVGKITKQIADQIREEYKSNKYLQKDLAIKYTLSSIQINRIINNKVWK